MGKWIVTDLNCEPSGYEPDALTIAPTIQIGIAGFEPAPSWTQIKRATKLHHIPKIGKSGLEPETCCHCFEVGLRCFAN